MANQRDSLKKCVIYLPEALRTELEIIRKQTGMTLSQQARFSLRLWVKRCQSAKGGAESVAAQVQGLALMGVQNAPGTGQDAPGAPNGGKPGPVCYQDQIDALGPEPDQMDPAWPGWAAKAGDLTVKMLASGEQPKAWKTQQN